MNIEGGKTSPKAEVQQARTDKQAVSANPKQSNKLLDNRSLAAAALMGVIAGACCGGEVEVHNADQNIEEDAGAGGSGGSDAGNCDTIKWSVHLLDTSGFLPVGGDNIAVTCWPVEVGCEKHTVEELTITRTGVGMSTDLGDVKLFNNYGQTVAGPGSFNSDNKVYYTDSFDLGANAKDLLCLTVDIMPNAEIGGQHAFSIDSPSDITLNPPVEVEGDFPLTGSIYTIAGQ